jgi:hypothetical protein
MKRWVVTASAAMLICCGICSGVGIVKNGSFENDGYIEYVTQADRPEYWCNVSYDQSKFVTSVRNDWATDGDYSLIMFTYEFGTFQPNDTATISQSVYLTNANQLLFDVYLAGYGYPWDPNIVTARVLIDDNEVWNSDGLQFTSGRFEGEVVVDVNQNFKDGNAHILSLQLSTDVSNMDYVRYIVQWDFVRFSYACHLPGDLTGDCIVDINDLNSLAQGWLSPTGPDLTGDGIANFADFAVLADFWQTTGDSNSVPSQDNLLDADLNDDGIVDFSDVIVLCGDWLAEGGPCVRADLKQDGVIDLKDFAILAKSWLFTGSLYGW